MHLHLLQNQLDLVNVQYVSPILVCMQESHHRFGLERVELIQSLIVHLSFPYEHDYAYLQLLLFEGSLESEREAVHVLRVEDQTVL